MKNYYGFWVRMIQSSFSGSKVYFAWLGFLSVLMVLGGISYYHHLREGLILTNMSDQVSWGIGIANFTFFIGIAASPVLLVVPAYVYGDKKIESVVLIGQLIAFSAVLMALLFVVTDIGRPDRFWHMMPGVGGRLNFPTSLLAWDVVVCTIYIGLSLHIPGYLLYKKYLGEEPKAIYYKPIISLAIAWAFILHTVTAFLLVGLGSRSFWNQAILEPRFLVSAFASGPAFMIVMFSLLNRFSKFQVDPYVFNYLKSVLRIMLPIDLSLVGCEVFKEFYTNSLSAVSARYLYFGLHGHNMLTKFIWTAIAFNLTAIVILSVKKWRDSSQLTLVACGLTLFGIWTEKGMGLILPGFIPSPLGEIKEYAPNAAEILVCLGILGLGLFLLSVMSKVAIAIQTGDLRIDLRK